MHGEHYYVARRTFGDGQDLASLVLMAGAVRAGNYEEANRLLDTLSAPALKSFLQPVVGNWLNAALGKQLPATTENLSLLQALHRGHAAEWAQQTKAADAVFDQLSKAQLTPAGEMLYRRARQLLDDAGGTERAARKSSAGWESEIWLAVEILFPAWLLLACPLVTERDLAPYRDLWAQRLDALDTEIARGRRARASGEQS